MASAASLEKAWLVLAHQLPARPPGIRVRIWRRLQAIGALAIKNSVYVLPDRDACREDLEWLRREIEAAGADATLLRASFVSGMSDDECVGRFRAAAAAEYAALAEELPREAGRGRRAPRGNAAVDPGKLARWRERFAAIERRDFFGADGHLELGTRLRQLERPGPDDEEGVRVGASRKTAAAAAAAKKALRGRVWTTRAGVHVDRMASAWLVRRFIDPKARFRFVEGSRIDPVPGEVRFDSFGGEFTHDGDMCTFEVLVSRLGLRAPGLMKLARIVHDIDLKDDRRPLAETAGVAAAIDGIAASAPDDATRIERATSLFDGLLARFAQER